jgi:hypothetical protein
MKIIVEDTFYNEYQVFNKSEFITHVQMHVYSGPKEDMPQTIKACTEVVNATTDLKIIGDMISIHNL